MGVYNYARTRIPADELDNASLTLLCDTITDRLALRLGVSELPSTFERIGADAVVKMFRRMYYEGITTESMQGATHISTTFVNDILAEYEEEIDAYKSANSGIVRFL